ncbi:MAG: D-aminoacylase [bacterium]|nr:D-aminoacylase [bacterium]
MFDLLIKNAKIFDGEVFLAEGLSVGTQGPKIVYIGKLKEQAKRVIDAEGLVLSPGFIDIHSHSEFTVLSNPSSDSKIKQGVTTEITANCGSGPWPVEGAAGERIKERVASLGLELGWDSLGGYFDSVLKAGPAINIGALIGLGNVRGSVVGYENKVPGKEELGRMRALIDEGMKEGALGISSGLMYPPGVYAGTDEVISCAEAAGRFGGIYATHMRNESEGLVESVKEALKIGKEANIKVQISHLKTVGKSNWDKLEKVFSLIEQARKEGIDVTCDRYPYTASYTSLDIVLPHWMFEGGNTRELERLKDPVLREELGKCLEREKSESYWHGVKVLSVSTEENKELEGKSIMEIAGLRGRKAVDIFFDLLIRERLEVYAAFFNMSEENMFKIINKDYCMIGSDAASRKDSGKLAASKVHPRAYGTFPRAAGRFVRENRLTLEDALYKMTGQPSRKLKLKDRGFIRRGWEADLTLFDAAMLEDTASFEYSHRYPKGIKFVIVNGAVTVDNSEYTGVNGGTVVRSG